ncbi:hypothetical protein JQN72_17880 [Phycicoccus sp. CSK15P-2]|uniref:hypothetical protein n=1 Tax=Phycicoccus sp. CSK15P-2 TaxID=2807627 RepID=UPI001951D21A|nr:hypothetical protein [Phycicoccus sp. CSK15P-2]MBM6406106.1 hypothetical protein [Phycicoccus sp. CSK15P-2]
MLGPPAPTPFDPGVLRLARDLRASGIEPTAGGWHQVRHGVWMPRQSWSGLTPEQRHAARVHATALVVGREDPVFALSSAAAVWGLPRIEPWPESVRVLVETAQRGRSTAHVRPHVGRRSEAQQRFGLRVTPAARTVVDLARTGSFVTALAAADHALRFGLCTTDELLAEADAVPPRVRGRPVAGVVAALADARSMSVGESLSRARMYLLNLPRPDLQVEVLDDDGLVGVCDFGWDGVVGEFDGRVKYGVPDGAGQEDAAQVLWREKQREDRLRRRCRVARWTWAVAMDAPQLAARLDEQGIRQQAVNTWLPRVVRHP